MASGSHETPLQLRIIPCHVGWKSLGFHLELEDLGFHLELGSSLDSNLNWKFSRTSGNESCVYGHSDPRVCCHHSQVSALWYLVCHGIL